MDEENDAYHELVDCIASALDARDPYTGNHSRRVSDMACVLALKAGFSDAEVREIHFAAHLHDIGKIGIPDSVLLKKGRLDDAEWSVMRSHPKIGADILSRSPYFSRMAEMILHHHERFDGKGYPGGLSGREIPAGARIIAVCDSVDAMASTRSYRVALPLDVCRAEIEKNVGVMYDPVFAGIMLENWDFVEELYKAHRNDCEFCR